MEIHAEIMKAAERAVRLGRGSKQELIASVATALQAERESSNGVLIELNSLLEAANACLRATHDAICSGDIEAAKREIEKGEALNDAKRSIVTA